MKHFNGLAPAEAERLALLLEEMGEAQQAIGKILRHGYESYHPDEPSISNRQILTKELGDVLAAIDMMKGSDISPRGLSVRKNEKGLKVKKYLHHQ